MRYYAPADPCDEPLCITLATLEIVQETPGEHRVVVLLSCEWHIQRLWDGLVQGRDPNDPRLVGFFIQRHIA